MFTDGRTLDQVIAPELYKRSWRARRRPAIPALAIQRMKPWMAAVSLTAPALKAAGFNAELGVDKHFFDKAKTAGLERRALETVAYQFDRLDQMSPAVQEAMLRSVDRRSRHADVERQDDRRRVGRGRHVRRSRRCCWARCIESPELYERLLVERNRNWVAPVEAASAEDGVLRRRRRRASGRPATASSRCSRRRATASNSSEAVRARTVAGPSAERSRAATVPSHPRLAQGTALAVPSRGTAFVWPPGMPTYFQDLSQRIRGLRKRPGFLLAALLTLAVGIGANVTVFSLVNALLLRPLPFGDRSDRVVTLHSTHRLQARRTGTIRSCPYRDLLDLRRQAQSFDGVGGFLSRNFTVTTEDRRRAAARRVGDAGSVSGARRRADARAQLSCRRRRRRPASRRPSS